MKKNMILVFKVQLNFRVVLIFWGGHFHFSSHIHFLDRFHFEGNLPLGSSSILTSASKIVNFHCTEHYHPKDGEIVSANLFLPHSVQLGNFSSA